VAPPKPCTAIAPVVQKPCTMMAKTAPCIRSLRP
jgi:hypothetical protein